MSHPHHHQHARAIDRLGEVRPGDHLVHLYRTDEERDADAAEVLLAAMARGERALGLGGPAALEGLAAALAARGVDVPAALASGALRVQHHADHYLRGGRFDPEQVRLAWRALTDAAVADGFAGLMVAADMDWSLGPAPGTERLVEYEAALGLSFGPRFAAFCQYDLRRFDAAAVRGLLRTHALVAHRGRVLRNLVALPPTAALEAEPAAAEVDRLLAALHAQAQADDELRRSEARHRLLSENALDVIFRFVLTPSPRLEYVSPAATTVTGYTPEEHYAHGSMVEILVHPEDRHLVALDALPPPEGTSLELRMVRKDGRVIWTEQRNRTVLDEAGRPVAIEGVVRDITARKAAEAQLRGAERLASLGRLSAGVAHEINNPLAWIGSNAHFVDEALAELAASGTLGERAAELRQALSEVADGVRRVRGIVRGLMQFAAPAPERGRARRDVAQEVGAALAMARNELAHRATTRLDVPAGLPGVLAGETELAQVFLNLLINAAQALPEGAAPLHQVAVVARAEGGEVVVEVRDTGPGIPEAVRSHVFEPFFTTKASGAGLGLGLSVCHGIVTSLGGRISVACPPGGGSVFQVRLPAAAVEPAGAPASPPLGPGEAARRRRVLVVDDEPLVARGLARLLSPAHDVTALTSSAEALRRIEAGERWDAVLCDLMMPELTGMDLVDRLRTVAPELLPGLVLMTGGAYTERSRAFLAEGWPALQKPVEPAELRASVEAALRRATPG